MDEDLYLQRLKGIREKYGCSNLFPSEPKGSFILPKNVYPNPEMAYTPSRQEITPSRLKVQHFQQTPSRQERAASFSSTNAFTQPQKERSTYPNHQPDNRRLQNFNNFIQDLDQRIAEKQKLLNKRIKANEQALINVKEDPDPYYQGMNRYNSNRQLPKNIQHVERIAPRQAYERSLAKRQEYQPLKMTSHQISTIIERKQVLYDNMNREKFNPGNGMGKQKLKINNYSSPMVTKNENIPLSIDKHAMYSAENWSFGKLDNIQQRIKNVLKQAN